ncbi:hypothetical protein ABPG72_000744 [Tetrahymena utriculariae]
MQILDLLFEIQPLLEKVDESIKDVNDDKLEQLYKIFRNLFKSFNNDVSETSQMINDGTFDSNDNISKQKMKQIKERILNMKQELNNLKNKIFIPYKKYLVWIDQNVNGDENQFYLQEFNNICNGAIEVKSCTQNEDFRNFVQEHSDQMIYIIMSGKAAGDKFEGDGKNLAWIKQIKQQKPSSEFIYGIFIFTSYEGEKYFKPLIQSEKGLVLNVTSQPDIIFRDLRNLVFPKKSIRVVPVTKLCQLLDKELLDKFLLLAKEDYSKEQLTNFHPDKPYQISPNFNLSELKKEEFQNKTLIQRLESAIKIIKDQKIGIDKDILDAKNIYQKLEECFQTEDTNQISQNILKLYTKETNFYRFLNSLLSVLNQDLIIIFWDLIVCFRAALNIYNDSKFSLIQPPKKDNNQQEEKQIVPLYRGVSIPKDVFEQLYIPDQFISMCGFSSFSTDIDTAIRFSKMAGGLRVIFKVDYQCGSQQYPLRPKCLIELQEYDEKEYLMNCGTVFKIKSIYEKIDNCNEVLKYIINFILHFSQNKYIGMWLLHIRRTPDVGVYMIILEDINSALLISQRAIQLLNFNTSLQIYEYNQMNSINGIIYDQFTLSFYVFGTGIHHVDHNLNQISQIQSQEDKIVFVQCLDSRNLLIFFPEDNILQLQFEDSLLIQQAQISIRAYDRKDIQLLIQIINTNGFYIDGFIYCRELSLIIYNLNTSVFSQLYVFDIQQKSQVGQITGNLNQDGQVKGLAYEIQSFSFQYVGILGNYYIFDMYGQLGIENVFRIKDIVDRQEKVLGLDYDYRTNNLIIYTDQSLYIFDYTLVNQMLEISFANQLVQDQQIIYQNENLVVIQNVTISGITLNSQKNKTSSNQSLIILDQIQTVTLINLRIFDNKAYTANTNLILFSEIKTLTINQLEINNNDKIYSLIIFQNIETLIIESLQIQSNKRNTKSFNFQNNNDYNNFIRQESNLCYSSILCFVGCQNTYSFYYQKSNIIQLFFNEINLNKLNVTSNNVNPFSFLINLDNILVNINELNCIKNHNNMIIQKSKFLSIKNSQFIENQSLNGGAIYLDQIQTSIKIQKSLFQNNQAAQSGGAFYISVTNLISFEIDQESYITNNYALIGGGLRYVYPDTPSPQDYIPSQFPFRNIILKNIAELYGDNVALYLKNVQINQIIIQNDINKDQIYSSSMELYEISDFQSGGKLLLRAILLDQAERKLTFSKQKLIDQQYSPDIQKELENIQIQITNLQKKRNNNLRDCIIGEIIQEINQNIVIFQYCFNGTYSIIDPNTSNYTQLSESNYCKSCPYGSASCQDENIILQTTIIKKSQVKNIYGVETLKKFNKEKNELVNLNQCSQVLGHQLKNSYFENEDYLIFSSDLQESQLKAQDIKLSRFSSGVYFKQQIQHQISQLD